MLLWTFHLYLHGVLLLEHSALPCLLFFVLAGSCLHSGWKNHGMEGLGTAAHICISCHHPSIPVMGKRYKQQGWPGGLHLLQPRRQKGLNIQCSCLLPPPHPPHTDSISGSAQTGARPRYNPPAPPGATLEHCNLQAILGEHPQNKQMKRKNWQQNNSVQVCLTQFSLLFFSCWFESLLLFSRFCFWPRFTCSIWDLWRSPDSWDLQAPPSCPPCWLCSHDGSCNEIGH